MDKGNKKKFLPCYLRSYVKHSKAWFHLQLCDYILSLHIKQK